MACEKKEREGIDRYICKERIQQSFRIHQNKIITKYCRYFRVNNFSISGSSSSFLLCFNCIFLPSFCHNHLPSEKFILHFSLNYETICFTFENLILPLLSLSLSQIWIKPLEVSPTRLISRNGVSVKAKEIYRKHGLAEGRIEVYRGREGREVDVDVWREWPLLGCSIH